MELLHPPVCQSTKKTVTVPLPEYDTDRSSRQPTLMLPERCLSLPGVIPNRPQSEKKWEEVVYKMQVRIDILV